VRQFINVMSRVLLGAFFVHFVQNRNLVFVRKRETVFFRQKAIDKYKDVVYTVVSYIKRFIKVIIKRKNERKI